MNRIFIIGASVLQLPAIQKAKEMGLYVGVADYDSQAVGIPYADEFFEVSTIDEKGIYEAAKQFKADGIMTLATDMPMRSVAYATQKLGLVGISYDTAIKATDKGVMVQAFEENHVAHPWYFILSQYSDLEQVSDKITYPCISKPTDNAGSRGVILIQNREELEDAVQYSSLNGRGGSIIIEEYLQGKEVSVEIMVVDGKVCVLQVTDKLTTGAPYFVEMGHTQPSQVGTENVEAIKELATKAVEAVGITNGPAHVEIMLTKDGPKMIELGARMGGDCITTHLVPLSTGIDMVKATIDIALGNKPDIIPKFEKGSAIRYFETTCGIIRSISSVEDSKTIPGIMEISFSKKVGDMVRSINNSVDRIGFVISQGENVDSAKKMCEKALSKITINVL